MEPRGNLAARTRWPTTLRDALHALVAHQARHPLLPHAMACLTQVLGDARRPIRSVGTLVRGPNGDGQHRIALRSRRGPTLVTRSTRSPTPRTHDTSLRPEPWPDSRSRTRRLGRIVPDARANQAAAFPRMSRSTCNWRFSRRRRCSSARSSVVSDSGRSATIRTVLTHPIANGLLRRSNSFASSFVLRPARAKAMICLR